MSIFLSYREEQWDRLVRKVADRLTEVGLTPVAYHIANAIDFMDWMQDEVKRADSFVGLTTQPRLLRGG